ncbi:unnamed protein product [Strongylus vulgaris]|uniref:Uncharacterized protein n=1 Tax=Strongylus vulgaris TaxID=40348 RepID=A0A3P7IS10_STRVU|nr:unnamed protein product [Strongylus vulgaris]
MFFKTYLWISHDGTASSWRGGDSGCQTTKYSGGSSSTRISQVEKEFDVSDPPDAQIRVGHARSTTVWLIQSLDGSLIQIRSPPPSSKIAINRKLKKKVYQGVGGRRGVVYEHQIGGAPDACDWPIGEDSTKDYDLLFRGLRA